MHDLSGESSLSRDLDKITKPSMQRNGEINGSSQGNKQRKMPKGTRRSAWLRNEDSGRKRVRETSVRPDQTEPFSQ